MAALFWLLRSLWADLDEAGVDDDGDFSSNWRYLILFSKNIYLSQINVQKFLYNGTKEFVHWLARSSWRLTLRVIGIEVAPFAALLKLPCLVMEMVMVMVMVQMIKKSHLDLLKLFPTASLTLSSTWGKVFKIVAIIIIIIIRGINIVIPN